MTPPPDPYEHRPTQARPDDRRHGRAVLGLSYVIWLVLALVVVAIFVAIVIAES